MQKLQTIIKTSQKNIKLISISSNLISLEKAENINVARAYRPYARERIGWSRIS